MPKVQLRTLMAGPEGVLQPGWHEFDEETAQALVAGGYAVQEVVETAAVEAPEQAVMPRGARKKG